MSVHTVTNACVHAHTRTCVRAHGHTRVATHVFRHMYSELKIYFMVGGELVDSREGCTSDAEGYEFFSRIGSVTEMDRGVQGREGLDIVCARLQRACERVGIRRVCQGCVDRSCGKGEIRVSGKLCEGSTRVRMASDGEGPTCSRDCRT